MYAYLTIKNLSADSAVKIYADGIFLSEVLCGKQSRRITLPCGSCRLQVNNSRGKIMFDLWLSIAPFTENTIELHSGFCSLICRLSEKFYQNPGV